MVMAQEGEKLLCLLESTHPATAVEQHHPWSLNRKKVSIKLALFGATKWKMLSMHNQWWKWLSSAPSPRSLEAVDGHLESCTRAKYIYGFCLPIVPLINQLTQQRKKKPSPPLKEEKYAMKRRWDGTFQLSENLRLISSESIRAQKIYGENHFLDLFFIIQV